MNSAVLAPAHFAPRFFPCRWGLALFVGVLLAGGQAFHGQLAFAGLAGTAEAPIVFSISPPAAGTGDARATIDARGSVAAVHRKNSRHVRISDLVVTDQLRPASGPAGGLTWEDYTPRHALLVKDRGIQISRIPHDDTGLKVGLELERDIPATRSSAGPTRARVKCRRLVWVDPVL